MSLIKILEEAGLNEKEARIYLALLELREATPAVLARRADLKRPTTYIVLDTLKRKHLVREIKRNGMLHYQSGDPHLLIEAQNAKYKRLEEALPTMLNLHSRFEQVPQMQIFEGKEGLIRVMEDTLTTKTEICVWANADQAVNTVLKDYYPTYVKKKVAGKVHVTAIVGSDQTATEFKAKGKEELRKIYLIPRDKFCFSNEINIYDNKVAIISHADQVAVIIENKHIADTQRAIFRFALEYAKILDPD